MESIFTRPYRYRESEKKNDLENYLSEVFAGVLRKDQGFLTEFLNKIDSSTEVIENIHIRTQVTHQFGNENFRPDIQIEIGNEVLIFIENKIESSERPNQLNHYCEVLERSESFQKKILVYLTKYYVSKDIENAPITFKQLTWSEIGSIAGKHGILSKELASFIKDKRINMNKDFTHLDAIVLENIGVVFEKLDHVLDSAHDYHKKDEVIGIRLDGGRSIGSIKKYGYYIRGEVNNKKLIMGYFNSPIELIYRIDSPFILEEVKSGLKKCGWSESQNNNRIWLEKKEKLSRFMTQEEDEIYLMIDFLKGAINDLRKFKDKIL